MPSAPNPASNQPISPGTVTAPAPASGTTPATSGSGYPQWGLSCTDAGTTATTCTVKEATTAAEKQTDITAGYDQWFTTQAAANAAKSSNTSPVLNGSTPPVPGWSLLVSGIKAWFPRALKVIVGGILVISGIMRITGAEKDLVSMATNAVKSAGPAMMLA